MIAPALALLKGKSYTMPLAFSKRWATCPSFLFLLDHFFFLSLNFGGGEMKQEKWSKFSTKVGRPRKVRYGLQFEVLRKQKLMRFLELWEAERFRHFGLGSWWEFCNTAGRCPSAPDAWIAFMLSFRLEQKGVIFIVLQRELWLMFHNLDLPHGSYCITMSIQL
jgi:hypothetical protein